MTRGDSTDEEDDDVTQIISDDFAYRRKPIFCVGISSAWADVVAKLEKEEYDVGLQMEFSLPKSRHNSTIRILDILFSSNHNIYKSLCGLCFWTLDPLIERY